MGCVMIPIGKLTVQLLQAFCALLLPEVSCNVERAQGVGK